MSEYSLNFLEWFFLGDGWWQLLLPFVSVWGLLMGVRILLRVTRASVLDDE